VPGGLDPPVDAGPPSPDATSPQSRVRGGRAPWMVAFLCAIFCAIVIVMLADPKLVPTDSATKALGIAPKKTESAQTTTTTTTTTATTTPVDPITATTTTTGIDRRTPTATTTRRQVPVVVPTTAPTTTVVTTTTTTDPPVTTTSTEAAHTTNHIAKTTEPGALGYPDPGVISSQYKVTTTGGVVEGTATWSGAATLTITVSCAGGSPTSSQSGASGLAVSAICGAGPATVTIAESGATTPTISYQLVISYPAS
jgi:hypothetical protein